MTTIRRQRRLGAPKLSLALSDFLLGIVRSPAEVAALQAQAIDYNPFLRIYAASRWSPAEVEALRKKYRAALEARLPEKNIDWGRFREDVRIASEREWRDCIQTAREISGVGTPAYWSRRRAYGVPDDFEPAMTREGMESR